MAHKNLLSEYLRKKRESAKLSQRYVSTQLGYSTPQFISNWERGVSQPPVFSIKKVASIYGISSDELFEKILSATIQETTSDMRRKYAESIKGKQTAFSGLN